jgi:type I restriction-modification system DNA methylase subunit
MKNTSIIQKGLFDNLIRFDEEKKSVMYIHQNKKRNYLNPEEKVQVETYLKLVILYNYDPKRITQFVSVKMGRDTKEADIIIYNDDELTEPYILVECKKSDISDLEFNQAVDQAWSYAVAEGAKYIWVTSGIKDEYYEISTRKPKQKVIVPDIPAFGIQTLAKYKYVRGGLDISKIKESKVPYKNQKFFELQIVSEEDLTRRFKQAHNALWAGGELNPSEAFDELDKLIFCKLKDETKKRKPGEPYDFQIITEDHEEKTNLELSKRIKALYELGRKEDKEVFKDDIRLSPPKIRAVVGYLEGVNLSKTDLDSKGRAFEAFMGSYFRGDFGQYFTPRAIVKFITEVLPIDNESKILDTSCGSGGFLLYALDKVRRQADDYYPDQIGDTENNIPEGREHYNFWHDFAQKNLYGIEINEQISRTAKMNMIIHDDGHTNVVTADGLLSAEFKQPVPGESRDEKDRRDSWNKNTIQGKTGNFNFSYSSFDFILTNPPFGSIIKQTEKAYLHQYNFGLKEVDWLDTKNTGIQNRANQNTEILFIEQCARYIMPGGYLAIVVPDGLLTNSSLQYVRDQIEEWYRIVAVVSMPQTAFTATGAGVKSSVLFLRKWSEAKSKQIVELKTSLKKMIRDKHNYEEVFESLEKEKNIIIKKHNGFENNTGLTDKKKIEQTDAFKEWKTEIQSDYSQKISDLKEKLEEEYFEQKQKSVDDYQIFMAIADEIGYDATGSENSILISKEEIPLNGTTKVKEIRRCDLFDEEIIKIIGENNKELIEKRMVIKSSGIAGALLEFINESLTGEDY